MHKCMCVSDINVISHIFNGVPSLLLPFCNYGVEMYTALEKN